MCRVQPSLRARGWPARGEPHDRPREQEFWCGSPRAGASRPHPRLVSGALGSLEPLLPSPVVARRAERTQPPQGPASLGMSEGGGPSASSASRRQHVEGGPMGVTAATEPGAEPG